MQFLLYKNPPKFGTSPGLLVETKQLNRFAIETISSLMGRASETEEVIPVPRFEFMSLRTEEHAYVCEFSVHGDNQEFGAAVVRFPRQESKEFQIPLWEDWLGRHGFEVPGVNPDIAGAVILTKPLDFVDEQVVYAILEAAVAAFLEGCED